MISSRKVMDSISKILIPNLKGFKNKLPLLICISQKSQAKSREFRRLLNQIGTELWKKWNKWLKILPQDYLKMTNDKVRSKVLSWSENRPRNNLKKSWIQCWLSLTWSDLNLWSSVMIWTLPEGLPHLNLEFMNLNMVKRNKATL